MEFTALFLSRLQFAFTVSFHIIYPSFTIGLAAWLCVLQALYLRTKLPVYDRLFNFWLKIFGIAFGLGVVSGVVMAFQFGSNWSRLSELSRPDTGTAAVLRKLHGIRHRGLLLWRAHLRATQGFCGQLPAFHCHGGPRHYHERVLDHGEQQLDATPRGIRAAERRVRADGLGADHLSPVVWVRFPHMLLAAYITGAFCVAATGAWYRRYRRFDTESRVMLRMGLWLAAALVPMQLFVGHLTGDYVHEWQPAKFAAIEARWHDEQPAAEVLIAWPDSAHERNRAELRVPYLGSLIASMTLDSKEVGLTRFPKDQRPPVLIPFLAFRIMVGCGLLMLAVAWLGSLIVRRETMPFRPWMLRGILLSFPLPFIATLTGWFTAEVGRQPWTVYEVLRTADAVSPHLKATSALGSLIMFTLVYALIFAFGTRFIYRQLKVGPISPQLIPPVSAKRPLALGAAAPNE